MLAQLIAISAEYFRPRKPQTSTEDFPIGTLSPRGKPQGVGPTSNEGLNTCTQFPRGKPQGFGKPVENLQNEYVPGKPPSLTSTWAKSLPHTHVVRTVIGKQDRAPWTPLGIGQAEEKVNLRPDKLPAGTGSSTAGRSESEVFHREVGDKTHNLSGSTRGTGFGSQCGEGNLPPRTDSGRYVGTRVKFLGGYQPTKRL